MKILFKTTDRNEANAQLRAFTKNANANLDLRKESSEIHWLTKIITAPRFSLEYKGTITENNQPRDYFFNVALLVVTEYKAATILGARHFGGWFERRERCDRKYSFCVVVFNDNGEYILMDCNDMTSADANEFFNEVDKNRIR